MSMNFPTLGIATQAEYDALPPKERIVIAAAYFADVEKVRETGFNHGFWVAKFLKSVGLPEGFAWCNAFVSYVLGIAKVKGGPKTGRAAVRNWENWARDNNRLFPMDKAVRGDLIGYTLSSGKGHIEICTGQGESPGFKSSIGGNTGANGEREGDGVYRKRRQVKLSWWCIKL